MKIIKNDKAYSVVFENFISIHDFEIAYAEYKKSGGNLSKDDYLIDQFLKQIKNEK